MRSFNFVERASCGKTFDSATHSRRRSDVATAVVDFDRLLFAFAISLHLLEVGLDRKETLKQSKTFYDKSEYLLLSINIVWQSLMFQVHFKLP